MPNPLIGGGMLQYDIAGVAATTGGAVLSVLNPFGEDVVVTNTVLLVTTKSTGAANANIGIGAAATTDGDNLLDGVDVGTAAGVFDAAEDGGTNGRTRQLWESDQYLNVTGSDTTAGLVGKLFIECVRPVTAEA